MHHHQCCGCHYFWKNQSYEAKENTTKQDNKSVISLANGGKTSFGKQMRTIDIGHFHITDQIQRGNMSIQWWPMDEMTSDHMSEGLQGVKFRRQNNTRTLHIVWHFKMKKKDMCTCTQQAKWQNETFSELHDEGTRKPEFCKITVKRNFKRKWWICRDNHNDTMQRKKGMCSRWMIETTQSQRH